jgi:spermine oxidase
MNSIYHTTVIIGSGCAGIGAALELLDAKSDDFIIFEALDRVGGRIHTVPYGLYVLQNKR